MASARKQLLELAVIFTADGSQLDRETARNLKTMEKFGKKLEGMGRQLSLAVTLPIVGIGTAAIAASGEFEQAMAGVDKTVDATEEEIDALADAFQRLAEEQKRGFSAADLARIGELGGQLGRSKDTLLDFVEVVADVDVSTDLGIEDASVGLAQFSNITRTADGNLRRVGSTIVGLGNNSATTERRILEMGLRTAAAGTQAGFTEAQILGLSAGMASLGLESEAGGTAASRVIVKLADTVARGGKELEQFAGIAGASASEYKAAFERDAAGATVMFIEGLGQLADQGENVFAILEMLELDNIRVRDALLRAAGAGDLLRDSIALASDEWERNTALANEASKFYDTNRNRLIAMREQLRNMAADFGDAIAPAVLSFLRAGQPLLDLLAGMITGFGDLPPELQTVAVAMLALAAAAGPLLIAGGKAIQMMIALRGAVIGLQSASALGGLATLLTPGGLLLAGAAGFAALLLTLRRNAEEALPSIEEIRRSMLGLTEAQLESVKTQVILGTAEYDRQLEVMRGELEELLDRQAVITVQSKTSGLGPDSDLFNAAAFRIQDEIDEKLREIERTESRLQLMVDQFNEAESALSALGGRGYGDGDGVRDPKPPPPPPGDDAVQDIIDRLEAQVRTASALNDLLGDSFDDVATRAGAYRGAIEALLNEGVDPADARVLQYTDSLRRLEMVQELTEERTRAQEEAQQVFNAKLAEARSLIEASITPHEQFANRIDNLNGLLELGAISLEEYNRALAQARKEMEDAGKELDPLEEALLRVSRRMSGSLLDALTGARDGFRGFVSDALAQLERLAIQMAALGLIKEVFSPDSTTGQVLSFAFGGGRADGGSVSPGRAFLVGERGPELFAPAGSGTIVPNHDLRGQAPRTVVHQRIEFSPVTIDRRGVKQFFEENRGEVLRIVREATHESSV